MTVLLAKLLRKKGKTEVAAALLSQAAAFCPTSVAIFTEYCVNRMIARDFQAIMERCSAVASFLHAGNQLKDAASSFLTRASLDDDAPATTLTQLRNDFRQRAAESAAAFSLGDIAKARDAFRTALILARIPRKAFADWIAAFDATAAVGGHSSEMHRFVFASDNKSASTATPIQLRKLVVSGMYWSGSGAIYDYLREFDQVSAVEGELRLWKEGDFCLEALTTLFNEGKSFRDGLFRFLTIALTGVSPIANWQEELAVQYALKAVRSDHSGAYARACRHFAEDVLRLSATLAPVQEDFRAVAARLSDDLTHVWTNGKTEFTLLDNVVHIGKIQSIRLFGNATALCSFRDPRSNFVARWNENPRFHRDVGRFIDYYRTTRESFDTTFNGSVDVASRVVRVSFEDFIQSEKYRDTLAQTCGLDLGRRKKGKYFRPKASRKNIANWIDFPDQASIKQIERELAEYCMEIFND